MKSQRVYKKARVLTSGSRHLLSTESHNKLAGEIPESAVPSFGGYPTEEPVPEPSSPSFSRRRTKASSVWFSLEDEVTVPVLKDKYNESK